MSDTRLMHVIAYEGRTECPNCASPVFIPALVPETTCTSCHATVALTPMMDHVNRPPFFDNMLEGKDAWRKGPTELEIESQKYLSSRQKVPAPVCAGCAAELDISDLEGKSELTCACGVASAVRAAPRDGTVPRFVTHLVGEDPGALPGSTDEGAEAARPSRAAKKPVRFPCPACDASLSVDGSSRTVECTYCNTSAYLPNDLWRSLHPVSTVKRWYLVVDEALFQPFRRTQRVAWWWTKVGSASALAAMFVGPVIGTTTGLGWIGWIPEAVFVGSFVLCFVVSMRADTRHAATMR